MLQQIERYLTDQRESEEGWHPNQIAEDFFPWSFDFRKAEVHEWTTNWSKYFDEDLERRGTTC